MSVPSAIRPATVVVERDVPLPMGDGTILRADVWRPGEDGRWPTVLQRTPYDKGFSFITVHYGGIEPLLAVERGYAVVIQDTRGRFRSDGRFAAFVHEERDGADSVAWLRSQPWCDGSVFMYGGSYVGATQLLAPIARPEGLCGIVPQRTASDFYDGWSYRGGAFELSFSLYWTLTSLAAPELLRRAAAGDDVTEVGTALETLVNDPWLAFASLPLDAHAVLNELVPSYRDWLVHSTRDDFWRSVAVRDRYSSVEVPALHITGWYDIFSSGTIENFVRLREEAATEQGREGQFLIVGPWAHGNTTEALGEVDFGLPASLAALDLTELHLGFFDALRNGDLPDWPRVRAFDLGTSRWHALDTWPPPGSRIERLCLTSAGRANGLAGNGRLVWGSPDETPPDHFFYDPNDPVPTVGGPAILPGNFVGLHSGPRDQRRVEAREDVLVYTSEPLARPVFLAGPVRLVVSAATSAVDTDWTAKLVRVFADGAALILSEGILRARYRESLERPEFLEPDRPYKFEVDLAPTCIELAPGDRIRLEVSSSNFPRFDRNANAAVEPWAAREADFVVAKQTVFHDSTRPSYLELTVAV